MRPKVYDTNNIIKVAANVAVGRVEFRKKERTETKELFWEEEFEKNSQRSKGDLGQLYQFWKGELRLGKTKERTVRSHKIKEKGTDTAFEEPRGLKGMTKQLTNTCRRDCLEQTKGECLKK